MNFHGFIVGELAEFPKKCWLQPKKLNLVKLWRPHTTKTPPNGGLVRVIPYKSGKSRVVKYYLARLMMMIKGLLTIGSLINLGGRYVARFPPRWTIAGQIFAPEN